VLSFCLFVCLFAPLLDLNCFNLRSGGGGGGGGRKGARERERESHLSTLELVKLDSHLRSEINFLWVGVNKVLANPRRQHLNSAPRKRFAIGRRYNIRSLHSMVCSNLKLFFCFFLVG
jgi:hypothetical protein